MIAKKTKFIGLAAAFLAAGCVTTEPQVQEVQAWKWSSSSGELSATTKLLYDGYSCQVSAALTNNSSSDIAGYLEYLFFDKDGLFKSSAQIFINPLLPSSQTVVYEKKLSDSSGGKYYPNGCPTLERLSIRNHLRTK